MKESGIELMFSIIIGCIGIYATMFLSTTIGPSLAGEEVYGVFLFAISFLTGVIIGCSTLIILKLNRLK